MAEPVPRDPEPVSPTRAQRKRAAYAIEPVQTYKGQIIGRAFRRQPLFELMADRGQLSSHEVAALRFYREAYDVAQRPLYRCALDRTPRGEPARDGPSVARLQAERDVAHCERACRAVLDTLQRVALEDMSFSAIAMIRFGTRKDKMLPRSGRDRERIRLEFEYGCALLVQALGPRICLGATKGVISRR